MPLHADEYGTCVCDECKCKPKNISEKDFWKIMSNRKINSTISHQRGANQIQRLPVTTDNLLIMKSSLLITKPTY